MLCPEVWNFPIPKNNVSFQSGILNKRIEQTIANLINKHYFNEIVSIILPEENTLSNKITDLIKSSDYYIIRNLNLKDILRRDFIEAFIKRGDLSGISCNIKNELEDVFSITPEGFLILSIGKDLYQTIGLDGRPIDCSIKRKEKYIIHLDLKNIRFGSKQYERMNFALKAIEPVSIKLCWDPPESTLCPSSIAKYFSDLGYIVEQCAVKTNIHLENDLKFPKIEIDNGLVSKQDYSPHELVEYVSMAMLSCDINPENSHINSFGETRTLDNDDEDSESALIIHCKGIFSSNFINNLLKTIRELYKNKTNWIALSINGFQYSPINFFGNDHSFSMANGDNDYIIFFYPNNKYLLYKNVVSNKLPKS